MVGHIVLYTLKEGVDKSAAVAFIGSVLEPLAGKISGLLHMEIRQACQGGADYVLYSEFESLEEVQAYKKHPAHLAARAQFIHMIGTRIAGDYEI